MNQCTKETFALTFKKLSDSLANYQDRKLEQLQELPRRLPDAIIQPKVTFVPGRKRALTGREAADLQEKEEARERRRAQIVAEKQSQSDAQQEHAAAVRSQLQDEVAEAYAESQRIAESHDTINISSDSDDEIEDNIFKSDKFIDIDVILTGARSHEAPLSTAPLSIQPIRPSIQPPSTAPSVIQASSSRPTRDRTLTSKQASQNRRTIEKEEKKRAKLAKKPKTVDTTQLDEFELPFRSSQ